jgi:hypothetical protein
MKLDPIRESPEIKFWFNLKSSDFKSVQKYPKSKFVTTLRIHMMVKTNPEAMDHIFQYNLKRPDVKAVQKTLKIQNKQKKEKI